MQPHFKGMFEGVKNWRCTARATEAGELRVHADALAGRRDAPLDEEVPTHGRLEDWLNKVEAAMYRACKTSLRETLEQSKGMKKEKWVKQYPGQMIISAGCVVWTAECEKALADKDKAKSRRAHAEEEVGVLPE